MRASFFQAAAVALMMVGMAAPGSSAGGVAAHGDAGPVLVSWSFHEDFRHGIPAWMSYPLAQDVGYDPSLYIREVQSTPVLVRDVKSYGERRLHVGLLRPLRFHADSASAFMWHYTLEMGGYVQRVEFMLAAQDGRLYKTALPSSPGTHELTVQGQALGLTAQGAEVQAVVVEADVDSPVLNSSNRLMIYEFSLRAQRGAEVSLLKPDLVRLAGHVIPVAVRALTAGEPLVVQAKSGAPLNVSLYDPTGRPVRVGQEPPGNAGRRGAGYRIPLGERRQPGLWRAVVSTGRAQSEFQFLVMGSIPPHPRVLLTPQRLKELRSLSGTDHLVDAMRAKAAALRSTLAYSQAAGDNIALLPRVSVFPGLPDYFKLMEDYSNAIAFNAVEYALSGDPEPLDATRRALLAIARWPTWTPPWFAAHGLHTYYEVGVFSQRVAVGYDLVADQLTAAEKGAITEAAWKNAIEPTLQEYFLCDRMATASSNHMANSVGGSLALAVALYGDVPAWNERLGTALAELNVAYDHLLTGLFPGDGSEAEPAGYEAFAMEGMSSGMAALQALDIRPRDAHRMIQGFWWPRYAEVTPDLVLDTGDFGGQLRGLPGFAWEAEHADDPSLRAFYDTAEVGTLLGISNVENTGRLLEMAPGILDLSCCSKPAAPAPVPPPSRIFPGRGSAVLRSGWKPTDTVISIRVGPWFNHEHHDQGSFQAAAFGEKLISEAGYANYYRDPHYPTYFTQAPGHNTVLVDDDSFSQPGENGRYWKALAHYPQFTVHVFSPTVDYLAAELAEAYDGVLSRFRREFIFLKPDALVICDQLQASPAHRYQWLLHVPVGDVRKVQGADAFITGVRAEAALTAVGRNTAWKTEATPLAGDRYGDFDRQRLQQPSEYRLDSAPAPAARFLVGITFGKGTSGLAPAAALSENNSEGLRFESSGGVWNVMFRTGAGRLELAEFSTDGRILGNRRDASREIIFAAGARSLSRGGKALLEASSPVTISLQESPGEMELHVFCAGESRLKVRVVKSPGGAVVDGQGVQAEVVNGFLVLPKLGQGEHVVQILN
jgi:Heparinase II/III-like protein